MKSLIEREAEYREYLVDMESTSDNAIRHALQVARLKIPETSNNTLVSYICTYLGVSSDRVWRFIDAGM